MVHAQNTDSDVMNATKKAQDASSISQILSAIKVKLSYWIRVGKIRRMRGGRRIRNVYCLPVFGFSFTLSSSKDYAGIRHISVTANRKTNERISLLLKTPILC